MFFFQFSNILQRVTRSVLAVINRSNYFLDFTLYKTLVNVTEIRLIKMCMKHQSL